MFNENESLRGLFYIQRGQYRKKAPLVKCSDGEERYIGAYDPEDDTNNEWYMVIDNVVYHTMYAGSSIDGAIEAIKKTIFKYRTRKEYFKTICTYTNEDYYQVHYLGERPLTAEQRDKKTTEGRYPRTSHSTKMRCEAVSNTYGDYFKDIVEEAEEEAYREVKEDTPYKRAMKRSKLKLSLDTTKLSFNH